MQATLDDFLNLSRPLVPLTLRDTDLGALVAEVCTLHEGQLAQRRLHLAAVPRPGMTATVRADPRKVQQILVNLLQNAIEASPEGGAIELRLTASEAGVQVTIADAGPGLAPGLRGRAFERGMTTKPKGSGIGLEVARGLARQHGGDVTLESPAGRGCEATLALPWVAAVGAGGALSGEGASRTEEGTP
jgi:two-component system sensor histidine kinase HydH